MPAALLGTLALAWMDADQCARFLVDDRLTICWANASGRSWLERKAGIAEVEGRLWFGKSEPDLHALLHRARAKADGTCIPVPGTGAYMIICARLVSADGGRPIFGLTLRRTNEPAVEAPAPGVAQSFGLTSSEFKVVQMLFRGETAQQTAWELGVSVETVRTHIRRLYQELEVSSREALLTQVRPFMIAA